jgi:hypothetical protein
MQKLSSDKIAQVLKDASVALKSVTDERDTLAVKCASMERREEARKLASVMHGKGIRLDTDFDSLVSDLEKDAESGRFSVIQEAVDLVGPNMGMSQTLSDDVSGGGSNAFEAYILGNVG